MVYRGRRTRCGTDRCFQAKFRRDGLGTSTFVGYIRASLRPSCQARTCSRIRRSLLASFASTSDSPGRFPTVSCRVPTPTSVGRLGPFERETFRSGHDRDLRSGIDAKHRNHPSRYRWRTGGGGWVLLDGAQHRRFAAFRGCKRDAGHQLVPRRCEEDIQDDVGRSWKGNGG